MSKLKNKSEILVDAARLLHDKTYYPAVAHSAYYCCVQLMKHIWMFSREKCKTEQDLRDELEKMDERGGLHVFLIKQINKYIKSKNKNDSRTFNSRIWKLKDLRTDADYLNEDFDEIKSRDSLMLSSIIVPILQKY